MGFTATGLSMTFCTFAFALGLTACGASASEEPDDAASEGALTVGDLQGAERTAFMEVAHAEFYKQVGRTNPSVAFVVDKLSVAPDKQGVRFAFMRARPTTVDGRPYDLRGTPLDGGDGNTVYTVGKQIKGKWRILTMWIGPTDVAWEMMPCSDGVPASILGVSPDCRAYLGWAGTYTQAFAHGSSKLTIKTEHPFTFDIESSQGDGDLKAHDLVVTTDQDSTWLDTVTFRQGDCTLKFDKKSEREQTTIEVTQEGACKSIGFPASMEVGGTFTRD
jgi:hypothetical protein